MILNVQRHNLCHVEYDAATELDIVVLWLVDGWGEAACRWDIILW